MEGGTEMNDKLKQAIGVLTDYRKGDFVGDDEFCEAIDKVVAELEKELPVGFRCPCCGSERIYPTLAVHCNTCAVTSEI